jgi:hypothetical protein
LQKFSRKVADVWLGTNLDTQQMLQVIREVEVDPGIWTVG